MKKILTTLLVLVLISLVGCSPNNKNNNIEGKATKTITTAKGDVEIPTNPKKVVVDYFMGDAVALGVKPVGTTYIYKGAYFEDELKGVPSINGDNSYGEYSMEKIAALKPDLIITAFDNDFDKLSKIAPTVFVDYTNMSTEERLNLIGEALGKEDKVDVVLADLEKEVEKSKATLKEAGISDKTVSLFETSQKAVYVYGDKQGRGGDILYNLLGMQGPEIVEKEIIGGEQWRSISFEVLADYIGDYVMIGGWEEDPMDTVGNNPVWKNTEAIKNNHVIEYNSNAFIYQDIYSTKSQLKEVVNSLVEKSK
ncbi:ABC transporter substrate-binding protein [Metaclostridioides mangenotii]|uniref:ABC transporter substrate-binding protein n=1 Tax=Metaclostridioides mangenotii TaxID=1540 RepID=UPI0026F0A64D|nr:ABC transporter substrate-binding protein [Clostridioides mangenotii]